MKVFRHVLSWGFRLEAESLKIDISASNRQIDVKAQDVVESSYNGNWSISKKEFTMRQKLSCITTLL